jgi:hypothetical protein
MTLVIFDPEARSEFLAATRIMRRANVAWVVAIASLLNPLSFTLPRRLFFTVYYKHLSGVIFYRNFHFRLFILLSLITSISLRSRTINVDRDIGRIEFQILRAGSRSEQKP